MANTKQSDARADRRNWTLQVTQDDIDRAFRNDSYKCVVAQCIAREITDATRIEVDLATIRFTRGGERLIYLTAYEASEYIIAWDAGEDVHPFKLKLRNPMAVRRRVVSNIGGEVMRARNRRETVLRKRARAETVLAKPEEERSRAETLRAEEALAAVPEELAEAERRIAETAEKHRDSGEPLVPAVKPGMRKAPRRISKPKSRQYGRRLLRVNQGEGRVHYTSTSY